jgi:peptidyl-prolyl cis-trans isomerase SurA
MKRNSGMAVITAIIFCAWGAVLHAQQLVESVAGIVGNEVIYLSDVENNVAQVRSQGDKSPIDRLRCKMFEELLVSKLFLDQARIDSIIVSDAQIEGDLNMTLNNFIMKAGSEKALEDYFKKSMLEIRADLKKSLMNQQIISEVQSSISQNITVTPAEVKRFYQGIPKDSLPAVPSKVELSIIQLDPPANEANKADARQKLLELRSRILAGESFSTLAVLYSEDTESAKQGGEIGFMNRGGLEKEYADAAWGLNKNGVSRIVETKYGYHIIQMIERKGDMLNTRHILRRPMVKPDEAVMAMEKLDTIADKIRKDSITFSMAALKYSTHKDSRINGGKFVKTDPGAREQWHTLEELDRETYVIVRDMKIGEISKPFRTTDENGNVVFRIVKVDSEIPAHIADVKNDYQNLYNATLMDKRSKTYQTWINKKIGVTYIKISEEFKSCEFANKGWLK